MVILLCAAASPDVSTRPKTVAASLPKIVLMMSSGLPVGRTIEQRGSPEKVAHPLWSSAFRRHSIRRQKTAKGEDIHEPHCCYGIDRCCVRRRMWRDAPMAAGA